MNSKKLLYTLIGILAVLAIVLLIAGANAEALGAAGKSDVNRSAAGGNVERFMSNLEKRGFSWEKGEFSYLDLVKETCLGNAPNALANNPWPSAYAVLQFDPVPGQPAFPFPFPYQLREDGAIVMIGQTPPRTMYFSYQTFVAAPPDSQIPLLIPYGDTINNESAHLTGRDPFNRPIVIIITGNRAMEKQMRAALVAAGYPASIINVEALSPIIGPLGYGEEGSMLLTAQRLAGEESEEALRKYMTETVPAYEVFRITPDFELVDDPQPVPLLRARGTGRTEMELYPAMKELRKAILNEYSDMIPQEMDTRIWTLDEPWPFLVEKPFAQLQRGVSALGASRDTNYFATYPNFTLSSEDDFAIVYGVNHQKTGKVTYSSTSVYADKDRWLGVATMLSRDFGDSARRYLPDHPDADMLYALKVARECPDDDPYCLEVQYTFTDIYGEDYTCDPPLDLNTAELFLIIRTYLEPGRMVGPDDNELMYDRAILFTAP